MQDERTHQFSLQPHPSTRCDSVQRLEVRLSVPSPGVATLCYTLRADMSRVRVAPEGTPGSADGLWKHTCFEAFIRPEKSQGYYEFNFSPSRQWAVFRFDSYRKGMTQMDLSNPPVVSSTRSADCIVLQATFPLPFSADSAAARRTKLALAAVIEEESGTLCYWSGRHPQGKPDFHHSDGFAFELQL